MKFLDSKSEVIDIELTSYGKYLLSLGKFEPDSYAFFDSDVLYDGQYAGVSTEGQNEIHTRIKEIPQLETQHSFHSAEDEVLANNRLIREGKEELGSKRVQPTPDKHYSLTAPIGTISLESLSPPAWSISILEGKINSSVEFKESTDHPTLKIPQLEMKSIEYNTIAKILPIGENIANRTDLGLLINEFKDNSYIDIIEDNIVIDIKELNTIFGNENFEIEVFEVSSSPFGTTTKEILTPLSFGTKKLQLVKDGILLDEEQVITETPTLDSSFVEYFFEILTDEEVEDELVPTQTKKDLYTSVVREEDLPC